MEVLEKGKLVAMSPISSRLMASLKLAFTYLLEISKSGIAFHGKTKIKIGEKMEILEYQTDFQRLLSILNILNELGSSDEFQVLNAEGFSMETEVKDNDRINIVFNYVKANFKEAISLDEIGEYHLFVGILKKLPIRLLCSF